MPATSKDCMNFPEKFHIFSMRQYVTLYIRTLRPPGCADLTGSVGGHIECHPLISARVVDIPYEIEEGGRQRLTLTGIADLLIFVVDSEAIEEWWFFVLFVRVQDTHTVFSFVGGKGKDI